MTGIATPLGEANLRGIGILSVVFGLALLAPVWAQGEPDPASQPPAGTPAASDPAAPGEPKAEVPAKEPVPEGEAKKESPPKEEAAKEEPEDNGTIGDLLGFPVHGRLSLKYRLRWQVSKDGHASDNDLYQVLSADIGNRKKHLITAHFSLRVSEDLDGEHNSSGGFVYDSLQDSYSSRVHGDVYYAYAELHRVLFIESARVGRQTLDESPVVFHFDGARVDTMEWKKVFSLQAGAYAGIPVHYYESSWRGDSIYGAWVQAKPWTGARFRAEYTRIRDAFKGGTQRDELACFSGWQTIGDVFTVHARYSLLEGRSRDHLLRGDLYVADWDFRVNASWYRLYHTTKLTSLDTDFFTWTLHSYFPYDQFQLLVAKGFAKHINLQAGAELRAVSPYDEEGPGNRSFQRYFFSPGILDWPINGLSASATLEYWNVKHSSSGDQKSAGFEVSYKGKHGLKLTAGSSFALYKYDVYEDLEREHVQTYYAKVSYSPWKPLKFELGYQLEKNDRDDFHQVKLAVSYTF